MKKIIVIVLIITAGIIFMQTNAQKHSSKISMSGAWALYPLAVKWAQEYKKLHPDVRIDVSAGGAGKGISDVLAGFSDIANVSRELKDAERLKGAINLPVARDAVVAVVNEKNPLLAEIKAKGLTKSMCRTIWKQESPKNWNFFKAESNIPMNVYTRSDSCGAAETWAAFFDAKQEDLKGTGISGDPGIAEAVKKDIYGIGYNNLNYAYDPETKQPVAGLAIVPLNSDNSFSINSDELFYETREQFMNAVNLRQYPSPPARMLYFVLNGIPQKAAMKDFLRWIYTDGQKYAAPNGYVPLSAEEIDTAVKKAGL